MRYVVGKVTFYGWKPFTLNKPSDGEDIILFDITSGRTVVGWYDEESGVVTDDTGREFIVTSYCYWCYAPDVED